ncbi:MAG: hypothetical protein NZ534_13415, partial [Bacteroidia bacterium]|nr:hypothetical protein [Bacteroidia bacterium]
MPIGGGWEIYTSAPSVPLSSPYIIGTPSSSVDLDDAVEYTISDFAGSQLFSIEAQMVFSTTGNTGLWDFLFGSGPTFNPGSGSVNGSDVFGGVRFIYLSTPGAKVSVQVFSNDSWVPTSYPNLEPNTQYLMRVVANGDNPFT